MIISPKNAEPTTVEQLNELNMPTIMFLDVEGNLIEEEFTLSAKNFFVSLNDHSRYGKIETYKDKVVYYLKQFRGGRPGELLVDPYSVMSTPYDLSTSNDKRGERFCEYLQVKEDVFANYRDYLTSRNPRVFKYVEKQVQDMNY